jgi:hypothetical protein
LDEASGFFPGFFPGGAVVGRCYFYADARRDGMVHWRGMAWHGLFAVWLALDGGRRTDSGPDVFSLARRK